MQLRALAASSDASLTVSVEELREMERQLTKREAELEESKAMLAAATQHTAEYQQIAQEMENELTRFKTAQESEMNALRQQLATSAATIAELKAAAEAKAKEESTSSETAAQRMAELAEKENTIALQKREIEELRSSLQTQSQAAETVEANYREELLKHSQDLQAWREKEKEATRVQTELAETREKMETLAKEKAEREKAEEESEKVGEAAWRRGVEVERTARGEGAPAELCAGAERRVVQPVIAGECSFCGLTGSSLAKSARTLRCRPIRSPKTRLRVFGIWLCRCVATARSRAPRCRWRNETARRWRGR